MQPKLVTFGQARLFGKCSECGAIIPMVDAQYAGDSALAEHARILERLSVSTSEKNTALKAVQNRTTNLENQLASTGSEGVYIPYNNVANRANLICLARPSTFSVQIPYQFMSISYHRRPCRAAVG
jgi:hypothetical protein